MFGLQTSIPGASDSLTTLIIPTFFEMIVAAIIETAIITNLSAALWPLYPSRAT